jgi:predicted HD phosphohydrolase
MQVNKLYSCFNDSNNLDANCVKDLQDIVSEYTYFQPAWMLLAKAKYRTEDSSYQDTLSQAAARMFNRELLYDFIFEPIIEKASEKRIDTKLEKESDPKPKKTEAVSDKKMLKSKLEKAKEIQTPKPIVKENGEEVKSKEDLRAVVKERLAAIEEERKGAEEKKATEVEVSAEVKEAKTTNKKARTKFDIIESFIKQNPSINKPRDDDYAEELEIAKRSLDEQFDFVSETLAEIYIKQGHLSKAKKIYKQLILKYPEKSSYFAAQIKKIES